jgi:hypothetical protein
MSISAALMVLALSSFVSASGVSDNQTAGGNNGAPITRGSGASEGENSQGAALSNGSAVKLNRAYLIGHWTDDDDCNNAIEFTQDGRFITASGGEGIWMLERDRLTMTGRATATIRIIPIDRNTITVINEDGSLGRSTRC